MDEIMEEIDFINGQTPASAETMKAFQTNVKNGIKNAIKKIEWTEIANVNIVEAGISTFTELIQAKEVMILHESLNIYLVTIIPKQ